MRKFLLFLSVCLYPLNASAQSARDLDNMGRLAGMVLACGAYKPLYQFEEIVSRYISNTAPNQTAEETSLRQYARAKAESYTLYRDRNKRDCSDTVYSFTKMDIFNFKLYSDGTVRTSDGKYLYPRGQKKMAGNAQLIYPAR